jgi:dihydrofolate reductase
LRQLVYSVAASLDGFIAGPNGEHDWIVSDPAFDFAALWNRFDTLIMGRRTYEVALTRFHPIENLGKRIFVVSATLHPAQHPSATLLTSGVPEAVAALKAQPGKDIWLMGGAVLFRSLVDAGLVDRVEVMVIPVMLGGGVPLMPEGRRCHLHLGECKPYPSGVISLKYSVRTGNSQRASVPGPDFDIGTQTAG